MLGSIYLFGSAHYCRERLAAYAQAGVTTVALWFNSSPAAPMNEERIYSRQWKSSRRVSPETSA